MNTNQNSELNLSAKYLGPVFSLNGRLGSERQNLVFARNGVGKSFLSRAFRCLDKFGNSQNIDDAPTFLVSDEAPDQKGEFKVAQGGVALGSLQLDRQSNTVDADVYDTIFHVFSEDFVHEELRERQYNIDGDIDNQIAVIGENIKLDDALKKRDTAVEESTQAQHKLEEAFEKARVSVLMQKAAVNKRLREYGNLNLDRLITRNSTEPAPPNPGTKDILVALDRLKSIPSNPDYPDTISFPPDVGFDLRLLADDLNRATSPSTVAESIKRRIESQHDFYAVGTEMAIEGGLGTCPFCDQQLSLLEPKMLIDAYVAYFEDEEEKHRSKLHKHNEALSTFQRQASKIERQITLQKSRFDGLKTYLPSKKDSALIGCKLQLAALTDEIMSLRQLIERKTSDLASPIEFRENEFKKSFTGLQTAVEGNNRSVEKLRIGVERAEEERRSLQRKACHAFAFEFVIDNWQDIKGLEKLGDAVKASQVEIAEIESSAPPADARKRVAKTFERLLHEFFGDKYSFDQKSFTLRRGSREMVRGPQRTLSDGEKTAIAFCYFIASIHRKVESENDYKRLFLVFDDPVTSMSYDFIFTIAQILKNLSISDAGEISTNAEKKTLNTYSKPRLFILTHSSYFFNISVTHNVVKRRSAFALHQRTTEHTITRMGQYIAPFQHQLKDVYEIANGREPDHNSGIAIRSVLEAVGRFCRPDKFDSLETFVQHLAKEDKIVIRSLLINSLCHTLLLEDAPPPDDIRLACKEVIYVVEKYAAGQIELLKRDA